MGVHADHQGAKLHIRSPGDPIRVKRPARLHPVPAYAQEAVRATTSQLLTAFGHRLQNPTLDAQTATTKWEELKMDVARSTRLCVRARRKTLRHSIKKKLARLIRQQQRHATELVGAPVTVDGITDDFASLTLDETVVPSRAARLRRAITDYNQL
ncbi:hypothetical protein PF008_g1278 [Phytophthora fragariae]|uniref:Uncharacterized protein n=1 Tax=Phytophthora fragariae TaxID=53985 RepID=A0A6G0SKS8_9STRA|nr:hypothetical protein PF008_g1278 [Phytophthora fragariae]